MRAVLWVLFPSPLVLQKLPDRSFPQSPFSAVSTAALDLFFRFWVVCVFCESCFECSGSIGIGAGICDREGKRYSKREDKNSASARVGGRVCVLLSELNPGGEMRWVEEGPLSPAAVPSHGAARAGPWPHRSPRGHARPCAAQAAPKSVRGT